MLWYYSCCLRLSNEQRWVFGKNRSSTNFSRTEPPCTKPVFEVERVTRTWHAEKTQSLWKANRPSTLRTKCDFDDASWNLKQKLILNYALENIYLYVLPCVLHFLYRRHMYVYNHSQWYSSWNCWFSVSNHDEVCILSLLSRWRWNTYHIIS